MLHLPYQHTCPACGGPHTDGPPRPKLPSAQELRPYFGTYIPVPVTQLYYYGSQGNVRLSGTSTAFNFPVTNNTIGATGTGTSTLTLPGIGTYFIVGVGQMVSDGTGGDGAGTLTLTQSGTVAGLAGYGGSANTDSAYCSGGAGQAAKAVIFGFTTSNGADTVKFSLQYSSQSESTFKVYIAFLPTHAHVHF